MYESPQQSERDMLERIAMLERNVTQMRGQIARMIDEIERLLAKQ